MSNNVNIDSIKKINESNYTSSEIDAIVDFAEKGYEIFRTKILDAKSVLNILINIKPSLFNVTVTISDNKSIHNITINEEENKKNTNSTNGKINDFQNNSVIETNTEPPTKAAVLPDPVNTTDINFMFANIEELNSNFTTDFTSLHNSIEEEHTNINSTDARHEDINSTQQLNTTEHEHVDRKKLHESEGFFSKIGHTIVDVYRSLTSWF